jgi:hypothetical protein
MTPLYSKPVVDQIKAELHGRAEKFKASSGRAPRLAVILVGDDPASTIYTNKKRETALSIGMESEVIRMPGSATPAEVRAVVDRLNADPKTDGVLIQRPLPSSFKEEEVVYWIHPDKDVDAFHPENTRLSHLPKPSATMSLRTMAVSRLVLDNFDHIKAYWIMLGIGTAQAALAYGADDIDGTVRHELIYHDAGATTPEVLSVEHIRRLIAEAGREPVERDTLYHRVERDGSVWRSAEPVRAG